MIVRCGTMAVDMWTINLVCDGADEGEKRVQMEMDRDESLYGILAKDSLGSSIKEVAEHSSGTTNLDSSTRATINNSLQMEQDDYVERENLPAHYKDNCSKDKVVAKETSATPSNFEASQYQLNKISKRSTATVAASKHHRGTTSLSTGNTMKVGTKVYLQRWKNRNKTVAMGKLVSCDPTQKLDGVQLGK